MEPVNASTASQPLSRFDAILVSVILLSLMGVVIGIFGSDALMGATQVAMMMIGFLAALVGLKNGLSWAQIEQSIIHSSTKIVGPILIFLSIGALIGSFMLSGAVPSLLYYGLNILSPTYFYPLTCLICALVATCIGSSWTTAATIGVALIGVSYGFNLSPEITAGAIISGAYFGDKMSPLSETTNLAPAIAGSELFEHIRHMAWVSIPSFILAVMGFLIIGLNAPISAGSQAGIVAFVQTLDQHFVISPINLIPMALLLWLALKRVPAFVAIMGVSLLACVFSLIFQYDALLTFAGDSKVSHVIKAFWLVLFDGFNISTQNADVDLLLSRGGMASMVSMVWLVIASMMMTGVLEKIGYIAVLMRLMLKAVHSTGSLIASTMATCLGVNIVTGDQYMSLVLPGHMWKSEYNKRQLANVNLSRTLEDAGTLSSPLIPWNACGVYMAGTLAVTTVAYLPYCFFNLMNPLIALIFAFLNIKIIQLNAVNSSLPET
ncbi:sodium:proton antiporter [Paraglaciecola hydrolytica]|uniref:Sodium:proton antiporter n=2 Tax=Paraglaciecola hydrolytica TaxID=1799789 RepID=A0A135ZZN9_9ALTE|nr:sodium:proton antiporter [Paraglaciecola hydrolytica]